MRKWLVTGVVLAAVAVPTASRAQVSLGARVGYAYGFGDVAGDLSMGDWVQHQIPIQVDLLYRLTPSLAIGAYGSYGFGFVGGDASDVCDAPGADCSATVWRLGAQIVYSFAAMGQAAPWAGAGIGYEWNQLDAEDPTGSVDTEFRGWEYLNLQGGVDWRVGEQLAVGPFVMISFGQYGEGEVSGVGSGSVADEKWHEWLTVGLRGRFDL